MKKYISFLYTATFLLCSNLNAQDQKVITTIDSLILIETGGAQDNIYMPCIDGVAEEVLGACESIWHSYYVGRIYPHEFSSEMINDEYSWIVLNDTLKSDTAFTLIKINGKKKFTKYYPGGPKIQEGILTVLEPENLKYDYQNVPSQDISFCRKWVDSVYHNLPIATGYWKFYHQNGQLASEGEYVPKTKATVTQIIDYISGEPIYDLAINDYTDAEKTGEWKYYDEAGTLILSQTIENGKVIMMWCLP